MAGGRASRGPRRPEDPVGARGADMRSTRGTYLRRAAFAPFRSVAWRADDKANRLPDRAQGALSVGVNSPDLEGWR